MPSTNTVISCWDLSILIRIWEPFPADSPSGAAADFDLGCAGAGPGLGCAAAGCSAAVLGLTSAFGGLPPFCAVGGLPPFCALGGLPPFSALGGFEVGSAPAGDASVKAKKGRMNKAKACLGRLSRFDRRMMFPGFARNQRSA